MPSINYKQVYSRFYAKVQAYDFLYDEMDDATIEEFLCSFLHSSVAYPQIHKLFTTVALDDENKTITYEVKYVVDDDYDKQFIEEILGQQMIVQWIKPKITSLNTVVQHFSSSEAKFYSQSEHLKQLRALYSDLTTQIRSMISDRGGLNNAYLDGTSSSSTLIS